MTSFEWLRRRSAGGADIDAPCSDQFDAGCQTQGSAPIPWASRKFTIFSAGPLLAL